MKANRETLIHLLLIAIVFAASYATVFDPKLDLNGDNATYISLARNMAAGHGYCEIGPGGVTHPASHFPVGYPFILSVLISLGIDNLIVFKLLNGAFLLAGAVLLYLIAKGLTRTPSLAFAVTILTVMSVQLLRFASMAMSEMPYLFFQMLCLWALWKCSEKDKANTAFHIAVIAAVAGWYIRAIGASLVFTVLVYFISRREWKRCALAAGESATLILPWIIRGKVLGLKSRYMAPILAKNYWRPDEGQISSVREFLEKMWVNLDDTVLRGFRAVLFPGWKGYEAAHPTPVLTLITGFVILGIIIWGLWRLKAMRWPLLAFLAANIGFLLLWNGGNDYRYVTPFIPALMLGFWSGVWGLVEKVISRKWLPYAIVLIALGSIQPLKEQGKIASQKFPPQYENFFSIAKSFKGAKGYPVVCSRKPGLFQYFAPGTVCVSYKYTSDQEELLQGLEKAKVDYVVLDQLGYSSTYQYLYPCIMAHPERFQVVGHLEKPDTYLLKFIGNEQ